jgi:hypothetical protein
MEFFCLENSLFMMKISPPNEFSGADPGERALDCCFIALALQVYKTGPGMEVLERV